MLLGSNLLDFAIGLALIYLLLSILCSWMNERVASWTNLRARTLQDGIEGLLPGYGTMLLDHPLIRALANQHGKNRADGTPVSGDRRPSYIDARTFSTALIDQVFSTAVTESLQAIRKVLDGLSDDDVRAGLIAAARTARLKMASEQDSEVLAQAAVADLREVITQVSSLLGDAAQSLQSALRPNDAAALDRFEREIERVTSASTRPLLLNLVKAVEKQFKAGGVFAPRLADSIVELELRFARLLRGNTREEIIRLIGQIPTPQSVPDPSSGRAMMDLTILRQAVAAAPEAVRASLFPLIDAAEGNADAAQHNIEAWFNDAMQRLSGWYKRRTQWVIVGLGALVAIVFNADTFGMANALWRNDAQHTVAIAVAERQIEQGMPSNGAIDAQGGQEILDRIAALQIPFGYSAVSRTTGQPLSWFSEEWWKENLGNDAGAVVTRVLGWAVTAVAISFGAPFWFDLLNKLINLRNTGTPPPSPPQPSVTAGGRTDVTPRA